MTDTGTVSGAPDAAEDRPVAMRSRRFSRAVREAGVGYLFVLPALVVFGVFVFYPLVKTAYLGFFTSPPAPNLPPHYVGISQYRSVLGSS